MLGVSADIGIPDRRERHLQVPDVVNVGVLNAESSGKPVKHGPYSIEILGFIAAEGTYYRAFVGNDLDQMFGFELAQCFAKHSAGDSHLFRQLPLSEASPRCEMSVNDGLSDSLDFLLAEGVWDFVDVLLALLAHLTIL